jgi:ketosteroid isomerase-like protein
MSQENVEIVRRAFAEFERGNFWIPRGRGKASGVFTKWRHGAVWTIRDGKMISLISYPDPTDALEAVGLSEQDAHADS